MKIKTGTLALLTLAATLGAWAAPAGAHNEGLPSAPLSINKVAHLYNRPNLSGNNMAFFERRHPDGTVGRYVVVSTQGNGFDIYDVTDPEHVFVAGRYVLGDDPVANPQGAVQNSSLGFNDHPWVDVNPRRNIVVLSVEEQPVPSVTVRHATHGVIFVDISDIANPRALGRRDGLTGPHTVRMIGDTCVYTSLFTFFIDYTDPMNPVAVDKQGTPFQGHEFWEDPNIPNRTYVGTTVPGKWAVWDTTDCMNPQIVTEFTDTTSPRPQTAHEVYPAPDSSFVGVADFSQGLATTQCPGGAIHFYDISGKYVPGASLQSPRDMGQYFAPFVGTTGNDGSSNHGPCTMHSWQNNLEREIALGGLYAGGSWVIDPTSATRTEGEYTEYDGARGETTWGTTVANVRDALDFVNATQWWPFDATDPAHERVFFTAGWERGVDAYRYTGPWPEKLSRLALDATAPGGVVTGKLDRYAVLTYTGFENKPLAERTVTVSAGGATVEATTAADGTFTADLGLESGAHEVTVTWAGDETFREETTTRIVFVT